MKLVTVFSVMLTVVHLNAGDVEDSHERLKKGYTSAVGKANRNLKNAKQEREQAVSAITEKYLVALKKVMRAYTKAGQLDKALEVQTRIKEMETLLASGNTVNAEPPPKRKAPEKQAGEQEMEKALGYNLTWHKNGAKQGPNGHWYMVFNSVLSWDEAQKRCKDMGGYLATITSREEHTFVATLVNRNCWVGAILTPDKGWQWVTGEPFHYATWGNGYPQGIPSRDRMHLAPDGWSMINYPKAGARSLNSFMCEWEK